MRQNIQTLLTLGIRGVMDTSLNQLLAKLDQQPANNDLASAYGLKITNVAWEDTGRDKNSCVGPNISDMTLTVDSRRMPIIRKPNFSDITCDLKIAEFQVTVGNETKDGELRRIPLTEYIEQLTKYNGTGHAAQLSLLQDRDEHLLASAQACVLPLGHGTDDEGNEIKEVEFVPEIFNYQSSSSEPAILVIVASSQGTSAAILTSRAQKLFFNRGGESVQFLAKRLSVDRKERGVEDKGDMSAEEQDRNLIMIFQIPLKKTAHVPCYVPNKYDGYTPNMPSQPRSSGLLRSANICYQNASICEPDKGEESDEEMSFSLDDSLNFTPQTACCAHRKKNKTEKQAKGMENAMLRVSEKTHGSYSGLQNKLLLRDERFPIRVTLQHYKVSDSQLLSEDSINYIADKINDIYMNAEAKGSLVMSKPGQVPARLTEKTAVPVRQMPEFTNLSDKPLFGATHRRDDDWCSVTA